MSSTVKLCPKYISRGTKHFLGVLTPIVMDLLRPIDIAV